MVHTFGLTILSKISDIAVSAILSPLFGAVKQHVSFSKPEMYQ